MLITRIKASNFYGIKDDLEIHFTEGGTKSKIGYLNNGKERISLISGFYGSNASGKSTILNVIDAIIRTMLVKQQEFIIAPNGIKQEVVLVLPNYHNSMQGKPVMLEMDFIINNDAYSYSVSIGNEGTEIQDESIFKNNKKIFARINNQISFSPEIKKKLNFITKNIIAPRKSSFLSVLLDESSEISVFGNLKDEIGITNLRQITNHVCFITDKRTVLMGQNNINGLMAFAVNYLNSDSTKASELISIVNSIVKHFEPSFSEINIEKIGDNFPNDNATLKYEVKYTDFYKELSIMELSAGTRELIAFISDIIRILKTGGIIVYDETSMYYHPDMEIAILNLFKDKDLNRNNAQLFFTSHNHETFDILHNSQAHIVSKKNNNITVAKVSDFEVSERDNIKKLYRLGSLGGVPNTIDFNRIVNNLM